MQDSHILMDEQTLQLLGMLGFMVAAWIASRILGRTVHPITLQCLIGGLLLVVAGIPLTFLSAAMLIDPPDIGLCWQLYVVGPALLLGGGYLSLLGIGMLRK